MGRKRSYTDESFIKAVKNNITIADILRELNLSVIGNNYKTIKEGVKRLNLDTSHWKGRKFLQGKFRACRKTLEEVMVENSSFDAGGLKRRLLREGILENKCQLCGLEKEWQGKPIVLRLDHINGINDDHRLENLRIICPNCDSQTDTFTGRNKKIRKAIENEKTCNICNVSVSKSNKSGLCGSCASKKSFGNLCIPTKEILIEEVEKSNYSAVGRKYSVSDNAIRKRIKSVK